MPYQLHVEATVAAEQRRVTLNLFNTGEQGAVFHVYDRRDLTQIPRRFTVEAGKAVSDDWLAENEYHLWLLGPNGFHRELRGTLSRPQPEVRLRPTGRSLLLQLNNPSTEAIAVTLERCPYTQQGPWPITLPAGGSHQQAFDARASGGWYDLTLQGTDGWLRRLAGRLEDGEHSVSDPLMGQG